MVRAPNILWIVTTQWRGQALGYGGDVNVRTPFLDRWAGKSVNYTQAVTPHPFGPFARAAMLTGVHAPENGVMNYFDPLPLTARTVAHDLAERGYSTAFFGKWHLGIRDPEAPLVGIAHATTIVPPERRAGFQFWEGFESGFQLNDPWLHGTRIPRPQQFAGYQSDVICDRTAEFLRRPKFESTSSPDNAPWFVVASLEAPHPPYRAPSAGILPSDPASIQLRPNVPVGDEVEEKARQELAGYYAHIAATDRAIGRLLDGVDVNTTMVVFTSVHGDMHGSHGLFRKGWPYEESVRVPLLVRGPYGGDSMPRMSDALVSLVDLRDMTVGWAEGRNIVPARAVAAISMPSVVELPLQCDRLWRGVRSSTHKLILNADGSPWLYFDLKRDPWEQTNLIGDRSRKAEIETLRGAI